MYPHGQCAARANSTVNMATLDAWVMRGLEVGVGHVRRAPPAGAEDKSPFVAAFILMIHICFLNTALDSTRVRLIDLFRTLLHRPAGRSEPMTAPSSAGRNPAQRSDYVSHSSTQAC